MQSNLLCARYFTHMNPIWIHGFSIQIFQQQKKQQLTNLNDNS